MNFMKKHKGSIDIKPKGRAQGSMDSQSGSKLSLSLNLQEKRKAPIQLQMAPKPQMAPQGHPQGPHHAPSRSRNYFVASPQPKNYLFGDGEGEQKVDPMGMYQANTNMQVRIVLGPGQVKEFPTDKSMEVWLVKWRLWKMYGVFPLMQHLCYKDKYLLNTDTLGEVKPAISSGDTLELHKTRDNEDMLGSMHTTFQGYEKVMTRIKANEDKKAEILQEIKDLKESSINMLQRFDLAEVGDQFRQVQDKRRGISLLDQNFAKLEQKKQQLEEVFRDQNTLELLSAGIYIVDERRTDYARARLDLERLIRTEQSKLFGPLLQKLQQKLASFAEMNKTVFDNVSKLLDFGLCQNLQRDQGFNCLYVNNILETSYDVVELDGIKRSVYGPLKEEHVWIYRQPDDSTECDIFLANGTEIREPNVVPLLSWPRLNKRAHLSIRLDGAHQVANCRENFVDTVEKYQGARSDIFFCVEVTDDSPVEFQFSRCDAVLDTEYSSDEPVAKE